MEVMGHVGSVDFFLMVILHFVMRERFVKEGSIKTPVLLRFMSVIEPQKRKKKFCRNKGRTIRKLMGGGGGCGRRTKKNSRKGK